MPRSVPRETWLADASARFAALETWRQAHPHATWSEIEAAIDAELAPLRARLVGDTVQDFPHAAQRLTTAAVAVWNEGAQARQWAATQRAVLRTGDPKQVLATIAALPVRAATDSAAAAQVQAEVVAYLPPRLPQLQYARFRAQGLPIGSGIVESANKVVVEARLKGAGRRWAAAHVNPLVALRTALASDRWDEACDSIQQARRRMGHPAATQAAMAMGHPAPARAAAPARSAIGRLAPHTQPRIVNGRPPARHPWKQTYRRRQPSSPAKP